jgi:hypothetical protein
MLRLVCLEVFKKNRMSLPFLLRNRVGRLASSQQSSMARTLSRRSGLNDDCGSAQCNSEPPGKMESRALGRTDNRDCLGAWWYDILKVSLELELDLGRALGQRVGGVGVKNSNPDGRTRL